jgi:hypothetical protein
MKSQEDQHRRDVAYAVGDSVWLSTAHLPLREGTRKLAEKWIGPFAVTAIVSPQAYSLKLPASLRLHPTFHASQLKAVVGQPMHGLPAIQLEDQEQEFEVERILATRKVRGNT